MGLFDNIICEYPLPDGFDSSLLEWQTKDLECYMRTYRITADGQLIDDSGNTLSDFHGDVNFYGSNVIGGGFGYFMTKDDAPLLDRDYVARFTDGKLSRITGGEPRHAWEGKHVPRADFDRLCDEARQQTDRPTPERPAQ